jgi:uncharacterized protein (TIGR03435 family)
MRFIRNRGEEVGWTCEPIRRDARIRCMSRIAGINFVLFCFLFVESFVAGAVAQKPAFEVATIRPSKESVRFEHDGKTEFSSDTLRMQDVTVVTCIKLAYHVQDRQIVGPGWLGSDRFDITAKADGTADEDTMKRMLQSLLADRFGLSFHREPREMSVILLTVANGGAKLKPTAAPDAKPFRENSANGTIAKSMPIGEFADFLSGPLEIPIVDQTGLTGKYDFTLDFTPYLPDPAKNMDGTRPDTTAILKAALNDELGLKMTAGKAPVDVLVVDHVEKPSQN